jgi:hypothetical protein
MSWTRKARHFGGHAELWRAVKPQAELPGGSWFVSRFLDSSAVVVRRWGPAWASRARFFGREVGAWLLLVIWLGVPGALAIRLLHRLCG